MRLLAVALLVMILVGCAEVSRLFPPAPPAPIGPVFAGPDGGPPVECREVPERECLDAATAVARISSIDPADVVRVIVTCSADACTADQGEVQLDVLMRDGSLRPAGDANYVAD